MRFFVYTFLCLSWIVFPLGALHAQVQVQAKLDRNRIAVGDVASLTVVISGALSAKVLQPDVNGLNFNYVGQESSYNLVNGELSQHIAFYYELTAVQPGDYTIPSISVSAAGQNAQSAPLSLTVEGNGQAQSSPQTSTPAASFSPSSPSSYPASATSSAYAPTKAETNSSNELVFLRLYTTRQTVYVGEAVPIQIKLFVRENMPAQLKSLPSLDTTAFAINKLSRQPPQSVEVVNGIPYQTLTWNTALSPVKTGDYNLAAQIDLTVLEQEKMGHGGIYDDPLFAMFATRTREVDKTFSTSAQTWRVLPLPEEGKPAGFSGAIGDFQVSAHTDSTQVKVGEPLSVQWTIEGRGNFDRITAPIASNKEGWRFYPPSSKLELNEAGYAGKKIFEQAMVPEQANLTGLPPFNFSYFNPETGKYITKETSLPALAILPSSSPEKLVSSSPNVPSDTQDETANNSPFAPNKIDLGNAEPSMKPQVLNAWVILSQALSLTALVLGYIVYRKRRLENDPAYSAHRENDQIIRQSTEMMHQAVLNNDAARFFSNARRAIQRRLSIRWKVLPENITLPMIEQRAPELASSLREIFLLADAFSYGGEFKSDLLLAEWEPRVRQELENLKKI